MIDRLHRALQHIDTLPTVVQEEIAEHIEALIAPSQAIALPANFAGIWSDLQGDDEFAALEHMRHAVPPTPPIEEEA